MWVVDNPWPPFLLLAFASVLCAWRWSQTRRPKMAIAAGVLLLLAGLVHVVDALVVTESEIVEDRVHQMVASFEAKDLPKTLSYLSPTVAPVGIPIAIRSAMNFVEVDGHIDVKDMRVQMLPGNTRAVSRFRANARIIYQREHRDFQPSRWEFTWQKNADGIWQVSRVKRLDPLSDREISLFFPLSGDMRP